MASPAATSVNKSTFMDRDRVIAFIVPPLASGMILLYSARRHLILRIMRTIPLMLDGLFGAAFLESFRFDQIVSARDHAKAIFKLDQAGVHAPARDHSTGGKKS